MSIASDIVGSVAPVAAIAALGYLAAKKFGLIGDSSKDATTGDYDPLHLQDTMRDLAVPVGEAWDWMQPKGVFDPQTAQTVTFNPLNAPGASSLNQAIATFPATVGFPKSFNPDTGIPPETMNWLTGGMFGDYRSKAPRTFGGSGGGAAASVASAATGRTPGVSRGRKGTYGNISMAGAKSLAERIVQRSPTYHGGA